MSFLDHIEAIGGGSWIWGVLLIVFGLIGLINAYWAFMLWFKSFTEILNRKAKSAFWFALPLIISAFGFMALWEILKQL